QVHHLTTPPQSLCTPDTSETYSGFPCPRPPGQRLCRCSNLLPTNSSCRQLLNHPLDAVGASLQIPVNFFQRARWLEYIEVSVEGNLETDNTHLAIQRIGLASIDPGVRYVRFYFALEVAIHR